MNIQTTRRSHSCASDRTSLFCPNEIAIEAKVSFPVEENKIVLKRGNSHESPLKSDAVVSDLDFQTCRFEKEAQLCDMEDPVEHRNPKARWHSFDKQVIPKKYLGRIYMSSLTAAEMSQIKSMAALRLNSILNREKKFMTSSSKRVSNMFRKLFSYEQKQKIVKNSLQWYTQRFGCSLPPLILYTIDKICQEGTTMLGIFRKCGRKTNINLLEKMSIEDVIHKDLSLFSIYDFADYLKLFLRGLPEPIIMENICSILTSIHNYSPNYHLSLCQLCLILMTDESREALYLILNCLKTIADNSNMTSRNLAVCFAPCLTQTIITDSDSLKITGVNMSRATIYKNDESTRKGVDISSLTNSNANLVSTITFLIDNFDQLYSVPRELLGNSGPAPYQSVVPMRLEIIGRSEGDQYGNYESFMDNNIDELYEENKNKYRSWRSECAINGITIFSRKVKDSYPLCIYRGTIDLADVAASEVFRCYLSKGSLWSGNTERFVLRHLSTKSDVFYQRYSLHDNSFFDRDFTLLRQWRHVDNTYLLACTSIELSKQDLDPLDQSQQINKVFSGSRLVVEQLPGKSRINFTLRLDLKGRDPATYKLITPYIISQELISLREYYNPSQNKNTMMEFVV